MLESRPDAEESQQALVAKGGIETKAAADHLRRLPKVELHCHLEGAARPSSIRELAAKNRVSLPVDDPADLFTFDSLNQFLEIYDEYLVMRAADPPRARDARRPVDPKGR